jgi:hypothetical protein
MSKISKAFAGKYLFFSVILSKEKIKDNPNDREKENNQ